MIVARRRVVLGVSLSAAALAVPLLARQPAPSVAAADYARAEKFLAPALAGLVIGGSVTPNWLAADRFWYRTTILDGSSETVLVDPAAQTRVVCAPDTPACQALPAAALLGAPAGRGAAGGRGGRGGRAGGGPPRCLVRGNPPLALSPDGKRGVFVRDWNLWVRDVASGEDRQLTSDGAEVLRLRDRQRGLGEQRSRHGALVAGLEEGRHAAAGRAQRR